MNRPKVLTGTNLLLFSIVLISFMEFINVFSKASFWLSPEMFFAGKYYVLVTSSFVHADLAHLFFNCISIYVFGNLVESRIGVLRTYLVFFMGVTVSGLMWVALMPLPSIGASDGAFALLAAAVMLVPRKRITSTIPYLNKITSYMIIANFSTVLGVAALVHILGLASFATGSSALGLVTRIFSMFDPLSSIFQNVANLGGSSKVARSSHIVGFLTGGLAAYFMDKKDAVSNLKLFAAFMSFFLIFVLSPSLLYKIAGLLGLIGLTLYITPDVRKSDQMKEE